MKLSSKLTLHLAVAAYHDIHIVHHHHLEYFHLEYQQLIGQLLRKPLRYQSIERKSEKEKEILQK